MQVRLLLKQNGKNQQWLAQQLGVTPQTVTRWMQSAQGVPARYAAQISMLFASADDDMELYVERIVELEPLAAQQLEAAASSVGMTAEVFVAKLLMRFASSYVTLMYREDEQAPKVKGAGYEKLCQELGLDSLDV